MTQTAKPKEPVALGGLIIAAFVALGPMLVAFGVDLSADQLATTQAFVVAIVAVVAYLVRRKVAPVEKGASPISSEHQV